MNATFEFYDARATEAATAAKEATLDNVRERNLRAERTWRGLAEQSRSAALDRAKLESERAARREAEELAQAEAQQHAGTEAEHT
ncbi:hypothetical protein EH31_03750 [Erythrobacter longus]|uniref:Uncharacterized protein n=1 Tax=Erythrobacter longus TaxID=1044 RepID=A0A074MIW3_ERYLO|nr:hypothetical protein [Erythrobacter longus]KEO91798.1 hypothetical protein EH31_03750 [Erythrobacter longus]